MKYTYKIITDATANIPSQYYEEDFDVIPMDYVIDGKIYSTVDGFSSKEFYDKMRLDAAPSTTLINYQTAIDFFTPVLQGGQDIFYICFSSELSGTYKSLLEAKDDLLNKFPDRKIYVLNSLCAAGGEGLLNYYCLSKRAEGYSFEQLIAYAEEFKNHCYTIVTVDNLNSLYRGGRLSKTAAVVGTTMKVKPIIIVNYEGRLVPISKVVGRKLSIKASIDLFMEKSKDIDNGKLIVIEHADCLEDALQMKQKIEELTPYKNFLVTNIDPIIGSHLGPDAIILSFIAVNKEK